MFDLLEYRITWTSLQALRDALRGRLGEGVIMLHGVEEVPLGTLCMVELVHPATSASTQLAGEVVGAAPGAVKVSLLDRDGRLGERLAAFAGPVLHDPARAPGADPSPSAAAQGASSPAGAVRHDPGSDDDHADDAHLHDEHHAALLQERVRALSPTDRRKLATTGTQTERQVLERAFGKDVWDALLSNPRITAPEIARIARMGSLPTPLLTRITDSAAWLGSPQVRRALLSNPRLSGAALQKVLAATPRPELKLMAQQSAYPAPVREAARKLAMRGG